MKKIIKLIAEEILFFIANNSEEREFHYETIQLSNCLADVDYKNYEVTILSLDALTIYENISDAVEKELETEMWKALYARERRFEQEDRDAQDLLDTYKMLERML